MNIQEIYEEIEILENSDLTRQNALDLASLYVIKGEYEKLKFDGITCVKSSDTETELNDILPSYERYVNSKRNYQLGMGNDDTVIEDFNLLCLEISEFLMSLHCSLTTVKEKKLFKNTMEKILDIF